MTDAWKQQLHAGCDGDSLHFPGRQLLTAAAASAVVRQLDAAVGTLQGAAPAPNPSAPPLIAADAESPPAASRTIPHFALPYAGSIRAYFKGNGTNVLKIAPETSIKLGLNDYLRHHIHAETDSVAPWERMLCGGISGAVGQVRERVGRRESLRGPCVDDSMTCMWQSSSQCRVCSASDPLRTKRSEVLEHAASPHDDAPSLPACLARALFCTPPPKHTSCFTPCVNTHTCRALCTPWTRCARGWLCAAAQSTAESCPLPPSCGAQRALQPSTGGLYHQWCVSESWAAPVTWAAS